MASMHEPVSTTPTIQVTPVDEATAVAVRALQVRPEQRAFVGDIGFNLDDAQRDRLSEAMAILADGEVIGFYRLDRASRSVLGRWLDRPHLGLRGLLIDRAQQRRGLGLRAIRACCADARRRYRNHDLLALSVSRDNHAAVAAYRRAGFRDTGPLRRGGDAGPEQLMLLTLRGPKTVPTVRSASTAELPFA